MLYSLTPLHKKAQRKQVFSYGPFSSTPLSEWAVGVVVAALTLAQSRQDPTRRSHIIPFF